MNAPFRIIVALAALACPSIAAADSCVAAPVLRALDADETQRFDRLVTPEVVFPDRAVRELYDFVPLSSDAGWRSYTFQLRPEAGWSDRHFHLIVVTWARAGAFTTLATERTRSGGGPNGSVVVLSRRTTDGAYDLRVSEAMRLPDAAPAPAFDLSALASALLKRYDTAGAD